MSASDQILPSELLHRVADELYECITTKRPLDAGMYVVLHDGLMEVVEAVRVLEALGNAVQGLRGFLLENTAEGDPPQPAGTAPVTRNAAVRDALERADGNVVPLPPRPRPGIWHQGGDAA